MQTHVENAAHDDEEVKLVPTFPEVRPFVHAQPHGHDLDAHFEYEKDVENCINFVHEFYYSSPKLILVGVCSKLQTAQNDEHNYDVVEVRIFVQCIQKLTQPIVLIEKVKRLLAFDSDEVLNLLFLLLGLGNESLLLEYGHDLLFV